METVFYKVMPRGFANEYGLRTYGSETEANKALAEERDKVQAAGNFNWCYCKKTVKELNKNYRSDIIRLLNDVDEGAKYDEIIRIKYFDACTIEKAIKDYDNKYTIKF